MDGDPVGALAMDGQLVSEPVNRRSALIVPADRSLRPRIAPLSFTGSVAAGGAERLIDGIDRRRGSIPACGGRGGDRPTQRPDSALTCTDPSELVLFETRYGALRPSTGVEALVRGGVVERIGRPRSRPIPRDASVLSGSGDAATFLRSSLEVGAPAQIELGLGAGHALVTGGGPRLLARGRVAVAAGSEGFAPLSAPGFVASRHPRTLAGVKSDGTVLLVTVDGRRPGWSAGVTLPEAARMMRALGARTALNLDGGGSTGMVVLGELISRPSDPSGERAVSDGTACCMRRLAAITLALLAAAAPTAAAQSPEPAEVWAVGDAATPNDGARRLAAYIRAQRPDRFLYLGDVYEDGTSREFRLHYDPLYGSLARITDPTIGNHEWENRFSGYYPYWRAKKGRRQPPWTSTSLAGWQILSLNSMTGHASGSRQLRWLRKQVRATPGDCRIAFSHAPRFSAGEYEDDPGMAPLWNALRGHAKAFLSGHDHNLQRMRPSAASPSTSRERAARRAMGWIRAIRSSPGAPPASSARCESSSSRAGRPSSSATTAGACSTGAAEPASPSRPVLTVMEARSSPPRSRVRGAVRGRPPC